MARPKIDPSKRRTEQVNLRLSPAELMTLQGKADAAGTTAVAFARSAALGRTVKAPPTSSVDFDTRQELRRIGVNLNQIAKALNARREALPASLEATCAKLDALFDRIMPADGSEGRQFRP
jgi:hypothetical protein